MKINAYGAILCILNSSELFGFCLSAGEVGLSFSARFKSPRAEEHAWSPALLFPLCWTAGRYTHKHTLPVFMDNIFDSKCFTNSKHEITCPVMSLIPKQELPCNYVNVFCTLCHCYCQLSNICFIILRKTLLLFLENVVFYFWELSPLLPHDLLFSQKLSLHSHSLLFYNQLLLCVLLVKDPVDPSITMSVNDLITVVSAASLTLLRRDMSLNRRFYAWLLGADH